MERIAPLASNCFFVNRNGQREITDKKAAAPFLNILKDCLVMSVVIMAGATLSLLLG